MLLEQGLRSEFNVEIISSSAELGGSLKTYLSLAGYSATWQKEALTLEKAPDFPHATILDIGAVKNLSQFLESRIRLNGESVVLLVGPASIAAKVEPFRALGVYSVIVNGEGVETLALMQLDMVCSELFLRYQNEQLNEKTKSSEIMYENKLIEFKYLVESLETRAARMEETFSEEKNKLSRVIEDQGFQLQSQASQLEELIWLGRPIASQLSYRIMKDKAEPISTLINTLETEFKAENWNAWFFRFLPEIQSFVLSQYRSIDGANSPGAINFKPKSCSITDFMVQLQKEAKDKELSQFLENNLNIKNPLVYPFVFENFIMGFFCIEIDSRKSFETVKRRTDNILQVFLPLLAFFKAHTSGKGNLPKLDSLTQLEMRDAFDERLNSELARARRLSHSLTIIKLAIDNLREIETIHGQDVINMILAQVAIIIRSSSRINDCTYRIDDNEFALILPHTATKGAAIRAERLRRIIEMHEFSGYPPGHATVSMGISEYPSLANSPEELSLTASKALGYIQKRSLNKVCLYSLGENV